MLMVFSDKRLIALLVVLSVLVPLTAFGLTSPASVQPLAREGYLDLSGWDFDRDGNVRLDGEWEVYWNRLLTPGDFASGQQAGSGGAYSVVPSSWKPPESSSYGAATYRLRVKLGEAAAGALLGLEKNSIRMSSKLFIDGTESGLNGRPALSRSEYIMSNESYVTVFSPKGDEVEIIVQAANFDYWDGGIVQSLLLGKRANIFQTFIRGIVIASLTPAIVLIIGLWHLYIFFRKGQDRGALYYGIFCLTYLWFKLMYPEKIVLQLFPGLSADTMWKLQNTMMYISGVWLCILVKELTGTMLSRRFIRMVAVVMGGYGALCLILPLRFTTRVENAFFGFGIVCFLYIAYLLLAALVRNRVGPLGRSGMTGLLVAFLCLLVSLVDGVFFVHNLKTDNYLGYAAFTAFVLLCTRILSQRSHVSYFAAGARRRRTFAEGTVEAQLPGMLPGWRLPLNHMIALAQSALDKPGDRLELWVEDTGRGIALELQRHRPRLIYPEDSDEAGPLQGSCPELSLSRQLSGLHIEGSHVPTGPEASSRMMFPLAAVNSPADENRADRRTPGTESGAADLPLAAGKEAGAILLVAADALNLETLLNALRPESFHMLTAADGPQAMEEMRRGYRCDLIILDMEVRGSAGIEALRQIRERFSPIELPVLLLTAGTGLKKITEGFAAGANDYIARPFTSGELRARVMTLVQMKRSVEMLAASELSFLQAQIKPHFLFNALSVISSLSTRAPQKSKELLLHLSDYLRGSFSLSNGEGVVSLSAELQTVGAYLAIEQARFKERLRVVYDIEAEFDVAVPVLIVQPLVENAVRHGILGKPEGGTVTVAVKARQDGIRIRVGDDGRGIPEDKLSALLQPGDSRGVGLRNIHKRLIVLYGKGLSVESGPNRGTQVSLTIPI